MRKKNKKIYIWMLVCAALFIVVLYSPIGSPDLYRTINYYEQYQVDAKVSAIKPSITADLKQIKKVSNTAVKPLSTIQGSTINNLKGNSYKVSGSNNLDRKNGDNSTTGYVGFQSVSEKKSSSYNGGAGQYPVFSVNNKSVSDNFAANNLFTPKDVTTFENNNSLQGVDYTPDSGATDPGGEVLGPPIPVPDGFGFLLLLALSYLVIKRFKFFVP